MTTRNTTKKTTKAEAILKIAQTHLGLETIETRKSDSLDFYDLAVWTIRAALEAAYTAGHAAGYDAGRRATNRSLYRAGR